MDSLLAAMLSVLEPVCAALSAVHTAGVVHRDLKAANIMLPSRAEPSLLKLLDFGVAKLLHGHSPLYQTSTGLQLGTPHAMAPEQVRGDVVDYRTDVYALGVLIYQMLVGRYPFDANNAADVLELHLTAPPPLASDSVTSRWSACSAVVPGSKS